MEHNFATPDSAPEMRADLLNLPIKNYRAVNSWLYRGAQPNLAQFQMLREAGFKSVICLRWNSRAVNFERSVVPPLGFNLYCIPLSYWVLPTRKEIDRFFSIVDNSENRPIYIHCLHGSDRTGMLVAMYRIARENWSADEAYEEMKNCGFHRLSVYHMKWAVYRFHERWQRMKARSDEVV
jgi:tyrosine-protein phosphatase SIW14